MIFGKKRKRAPIPGHPIAMLLICIEVKYASLLRLCIGRSAFVRFRSPALSVSLYTGFQYVFFFGSFRFSLKYLALVDGQLVEPYASGRASLPAPRLHPAKSPRIKAAAKSINVKSDSFQESLLKGSNDATWFSGKGMDVK